MDAQPEGRAIIDDGVAEVLSLACGEGGREGDEGGGGVEEFP